ncbi:MAG: DUF4339 domain-containing protein [Planctomycetes bacterium]|nr:DUF4339 domain-containing protein [Planctomycetota bacterium]
MNDSAIWIGQGIGSLVFGVICAVIAPNRGRSAVGWFFIGFVLGCFGLIVLLLMPDLRVEQEKERRYREENRVLREMLRKERQVADSRHRVHGERLTAHDRALGLDTAAAELPHDRAAPPPPGTLPPPASSRQWYYAVDGARHGPVAGGELRDLWLDARVPDRALVWTDGMAGWRPIGEVGEALGGEA